MKKSGIINAQLAGALAALAHTDLLVIGDAGLPVESSREVVDLAVVYGVPGFEEVLAAVLDEIVVEAAWVSAPVDEFPAADWIDSRLKEPAERISHDSFKEKVGETVLAVRTGEDTPYANVILRCGVPFA